MIGFFEPEGFSISEVPSLINNGLGSMGIPIMLGADLASATMRDILQYARYAERKIMELAEKGITPSQIMNPAAFRNAIVAHNAIGGSTNATLKCTPAMLCPP